jgi:hypothetical protein
MEYGKGEECKEWKTKPDNRCKDKVVSVSPEDKNDKIGPVGCLESNKYTWNFEKNTWAAVSADNTLPSLRLFKGTNFSDVKEMERIANLFRMNTQTYVLKGRGCIRKMKKYMAPPTSLNTPLINVARTENQFFVPTGMMCA